METKTITLVEFLAARLDEDELLAHQAEHAGAWVAQLRDPTFRFVVAHGPRRALRDVEAKRAVLAEHKPWAEGAVVGLPGEGLDSMLDRLRDNTEEVCWRCTDARRQRLDTPCPTLRALAAVYVDHPDYRTSWEGSWPGSSASSGDTAGATGAAPTHGSAPSSAAPAANSSETDRGRE